MGVCVAIIFFMGKHLPWEEASEGREGGTACLEKKEERGRMGGCWTREERGREVKREEWSLFAVLSSLFMFFDVAPSCELGHILKLRN